jgi:hypothetical protein
VKGHFRIIKECIGYCARHNNEKMRLRDFRESLREESGQQEGCISQRRLGTFPKANLCVSVDTFVVVGGCTVQIHTVRTRRERGHKFRGIGGTNFKVVLRVFLATTNPYKSGCTTNCGHVFQGVFFWVGRTTKQTWHVFQGKICGLGGGGGEFGCCKWISLARNCNFVVDILS